MIITSASTIFSSHELSLIEETNHFWMILFIDKHWGMDMMLFWFSKNWKTIESRIYIFYVTLIAFFLALNANCLWLSIIVLHKVNALLIRKSDDVFLLHILCINYLFSCLLSAEGKCPLIFFKYLLKVVWLSIHWVYATGWMRLHNFKQSGGVVDFQTVSIHIRGCP